MPKATFLSSVGMIPSLIIAGIVCCNFTADAADNDSKPDLFGKNAYCGPQCVQRVLEHYGHRVELPELVHEIQWPHVERGSSMAALATALESRGIRCRAVTVPEHAFLDWEHPVIVHLDSSRQQHYVVWLPPRTAGGRPRLWDSALSPGVRNPLLFERLRSGAILLTSREPIPRTPMAGQIIDHSSIAGCAGVLLVIAFASGMIAFSRSKSPASPCQGS